MIFFLYVPAFFQNMNRDAMECQTRIGTANGMQHEKGFYKVKKQSDTFQWIKQQFNQTFDFIHQPIRLQKKQIDLFYIKTMVDGDHLHSTIMKPFFEMKVMEEYEAYIQSLPSQKQITSKQQVLEEIAKGSILIFIHETMFLFDFNKVHTDTVLESNIEPTIQGPQYAFSEDLMTNINIMRNQYKQTSLNVEVMTMGQKNNQSVAIVYDRELVDKTALKEVKKRMEKIKAISSFPVQS